jgi:hypothetical protein
MSSYLYVPPTRAPFHLQGRAPTIMGASTSLPLDLNLGVDCTCTFIDVGTTDGRTLFTWPHQLIKRYGNVVNATSASSVIPRRFHACLGGGSGARCWYGIEPLPGREGESLHIASEARKRGVPVRVFARTALATTTGSAAFHVAPRDSGSSLHGAAFATENTSLATSSVQTVRVQTVSAYDFVNSLAKTRRPGNFIGMKLDVEGSEYEILKDLLLRGSPALLCRTIDTLAVEWHNGGRPLSAYSPVGTSGVLEWLMRDPLCGMSVHRWSSDGPRRRQSIRQSRRLVSAS